MVTLNSCSWLQGTNLESFSTTLSVAMLRMFSSKMDSFLKKLTTSSSSFGFGLSSIGTACRAKVEQARVRAQVRCLHDCTLFPLTQELHNAALAHLLLNGNVLCKVQQDAETNVPEPHSEREGSE